MVLNKMICGEGFVVSKLPNFLIVGAAKSGTTYLHHALKEHPEIYLSDSKKESFFLTGMDFKDTNEAGGWYGQGVVCDFLEYQSLFAAARDESAVGEACVGYLYYYKNTIPNIKKYLGNDVKILIVLRDPVERAYSNYMHHVRDGFEKLSFRDALNNQEERMSQDYWWGYDLVGASLYYDSVRAYMENFENVRVFTHDDILLDARGFYSSVCDYLSVDDSFIPGNIEKKYNVSGSQKIPAIGRLLRGRSIIKSALKPLIPREVRRVLSDWAFDKNLKKSPLSAEDRACVLRYFEDDIVFLSDLLGRDFSSWMRR